MIWIVEMIERLAGYRRVTVTETERVLVMQNGRFTRILGPGEHRLRARNLVTQAYNLADGRLATDLERALTRERPDLAAAHLTEVRTGAAEVAVLKRDGLAHVVLVPERRVVVWTDAGPWDVERVDLTETLEVPQAVARSLVNAGMNAAMLTVEVRDGRVGLLLIDGAYARTLEAGTHRFWRVGRSLDVREVDLRWRTHDVTGQEILTADRVTLRVNISADYRVTDPVKAVTEVKDHADALHRSLQYAFRRTLGAKSLDALLAEKVSVDAEAAEAVRSEMAAIGIEVGAISLKDVILPGEMREILNTVVAAQKEAEANVIRRREETNATRSLLNTAKVMAENPVMLRLKELEALEAIAGKVERLTVMNGTQGLMHDVVKLGD